jgi:hypothetical protein
LGLQGVDRDAVTTTPQAIEQLLSAQLQLPDNRRLQAAMRSSREPVGLRETEHGDWTVHFLHVELGRIDRATRAFYPGLEWSAAPALKYHRKIWSSASRNGSPRVWNHAQPCCVATPTLHASPRRSRPPSQPVSEHAAPDRSEGVGETNVQ